MTFTLLALSLSPSLPFSFPPSLSLLLAHFDETSFHCELPSGEIYMAKNQGGRPLANSCWVTKALNPAHEEVTLGTTR